MTGNDHASTDQPEQPWARGWGAVIALSAVSVPLALVAAFLGWFMLAPFAGSRTPTTSWATLFWAGSALLLVGPFGVAPGPTRQGRAVVAVAVGVLWFIGGRFVLA